MRPRVLSYVAETLPYASLCRITFLSALTRPCAKCSSKPSTLHLAKTTFESGFTPIHKPLSKTTTTSISRHLLKHAHHSKLKGQKRKTQEWLENMEGRVPVGSEQVLTTPTVESSSMGRHIVIPVEEMDLSMKLKNFASDAKDDKVEKNEEEIALTGDKTECRFCQEDDFITKMEAPCFCNGTLKYAHRGCVQRWCNTKGSIICEICCEPYRPNYAVTDPHAIHADDETIINISDGWTIPGTNTQLQPPLLLAEIATDVTDRVAAALNDDCNFHNPSGGVICGTGLLLFLTLLIVRDAYYYAPPKEDKVFHAIFCIMIVILAPFYIMSWFYECRALRDSSRERGGGSRTV